MFYAKEWKLDELAEDPHGPKFAAQVRKVERLSRKFEKNKSRLDPSISSEAFMKMMSAKAEIVEKTHIITGFASLEYAADTQSDEATSLVTRMRKVGSDISNRMLFFDLWWKQDVDDKNARRLIQGAGELEYHLRHKRLVARYSLSEPEERIINTLDVTGIEALVKLYDKITNAFTYKVKVGGRTKTMTREHLTNLVKSPDAKTREAAYKSLLAKYADNVGVLGEIYQNVVHNWRNEAIEIRGYESSISVMNTSNGVDDRTVKSLLDSCRSNKAAFQRFFSQKARLIEMDKLSRYDLYAPIRDIVQKDYSYDMAVRMVLDSLHRFSPKIAGFARGIFEQDHVDSRVRPGKRDGAFCSTISPGIAPYVLVNYTGKLRDVFTLAHELGHAVHSQAAAGHSILVQEAPLPLAETASTFSELLLYDNISEKMEADEKIGILAAKIDDLYATIMRQAFFTLFEIDAHRNIAENLTTVQDISETYVANLRTQFGRTVSVSDDFAVEWSCIPHFYHSPFYCYSYAFGNLLAVSLFQRYKKEGKDFVPAYVEILSAGGSVKPETLLEQYGFDMGSSKFWQNGFSYVKSTIGKLAKI